jgi:hypothetical protein
MIGTRLQPMHRQVLLLATAQALFQTASTMVMTVGALAGSQIAPAPQLATAPMASMFQRRSQPPGKPPRTLGSRNKTLSAARR